MTVISQNEAPAFLEALSIEKFFGVGKMTAARLRNRGIHTGADLKHLGEERLRELLGKHGSQLYRYALGEDDRPLEPVRDRKSVSKELTFEHDLRDQHEMVRVLEQLATQVDRRLAELGIAGGALTLKLRWSDFELITRAASRAQGFQSAHEMLPVLHTLLTGLPVDKRAVRLLGVGVSGLLSLDELRRARLVITPSLWQNESGQV